MSCVVLYLGALLTLLHGGGAAHASATDQHDAAAAVDRRSLAAGAGFRFMRVHLDSNSLYRCVGTHTHTTARASHSTQPPPKLHHFFF